MRMPRRRIYRALNYEESQQSNGTTVKRRNDFQQRHRTAMYETQKEAIFSAASGEEKEFARYAAFATSTQIVLTDDDSESITTMQDLVILGI